MIDGKPRSATVTVDEDVHALAIDHADFESCWTIGPRSPGAC